jgi:Mg-chelatase subunit ChlD
MKNLTDITILLDRSGSMGAIKTATIEAVNSFLNDQKKDELKSLVSLIQFDDIYETVYTGENIDDVQYLSTESFQPRGLTALLDAIGISIVKIKKRIKQLPKKERPENVIVAIITDGMENASKKYSRTQIFNKIRKREEKNGWKFIFIAANQDAILEAGKFGIKSEQALQFSADDDGMKDAISSFSKEMYQMKRRGNKSFLFDEGDRKKQER